MSLDRNTSSNMDEMKEDRQRNREREVFTFNALHIGIVILTAVIIVVGALLLI